MANVRITTNTTGTQPTITLAVSGANMANAISLPFIQDVTITNKTGVYSYVTFTDADTRKLSTPADNEVSTNIVLDKTTYFGSNSSGTTAAELGVMGLSSSKTLLDFEIYWAGNVGNADIKTTGSGFITNLAPSTKPDAPVWVSPLSIAVDGGFTTVTNA